MKNRIRDLALGFRTLGIVSLSCCLVVLLPLLSTSAKAQTRKVDSVLVKSTAGVDSFNKYVFSYDSLKRMTMVEIYSRRSQTSTWGEPLRTVLHYDTKGRFILFAILHPQSSHRDLNTREIVVDSAYAECTNYEYDSEGHKISEYTSDTKTKSNQTFIKTDYTYDSQGRKTSATSFEKQGEGEWAPIKRLEYVYDSKGVLKNRLLMMPQNTKKWKRGKIVQTDEVWKTVCTDLCDKKGNIIESRDYDSDEIIYYTYDDKNQLVEYHSLRPEYDSLTNKRIYKTIIDKTERIYDSFGNVVHIDKYYPTQWGSTKFDHAVSVVATYNNDIPASDVADLDKVFYFVGLNDRTDPLKNFKETNIGYPFFCKSLPLLVKTSYAAREMSDMKIYLGNFRVTGE